VLHIVTCVRVTLLSHVSHIWNTPWRCWIMSRIAHVWHDSYGSCDMTRMARMNRSMAHMNEFIHIIWVWLVWLDSSEPWHTCAMCEYEYDSYEYESNSYEWIRVWLVWFVCIWGMSHMCQVWIRVWLVWTNTSLTRMTCIHTSHVTHVRCENTSMTRMNEYEDGSYASYSYEPSSTCAMWENEYDSYEWIRVWRV